MSNATPFQKDVNTASAAACGEWWKGPGATPAAQFVRPNVFGTGKGAVMLCLLSTPPFHILGALSQIGARFVP
jgi:hypothetical protein